MLKVLTLDNQSAWDDTVKSFKEWDVHYLSGYVKAFHVHGDGEPKLLFIENGNSRAINVVMERIIDNDRIDYATPYGYGGFLVEGDSTSGIFEEYQRYCKENYVVSEFVRFAPFLDNAKNSACFYKVTDIGETISIKLDLPNDIWDNFSSKNRNVIRKSISSGVEIKFGRDKALFDAFFKMYEHTMLRNDAKDYYYFKDEFYESIRNDLAENSVLFYAVRQDEIIAMAIILFGNKYAHYHLSAAYREHMQYAPMNLLLYEAAKWAKEKNCQSLHLGGGIGGGRDSLFEFKHAFNKSEINTFSIGKKIFDTKMYELLVEEKKKIKPDLNTKFFPLYRG